MAILDFSFSGWHGFGSVTQVCFGISVSNFMCMFFVAVGRSLTIVSCVAFKMAALWFWTMPPSPMGRGGILVDHWSTISSFLCNLLCIFTCVIQVGEQAYSCDTTKYIYKCVSISEYHEVYAMSVSEDLYTRVYKSSDIDITWTPWCLQNIGNLIVCSAACSYW